MNNPVKRFKKNKTKRLTLFECSTNTYAHNEQLSPIIYPFKLTCTDRNENLGHYNITRTFPKLLVTKPVVKQGTRWHLDIIFTLIPLGFLYVKCLETTASQSHAFFRNAKKWLFSLSNESQLLGHLSKRLQFRCIKDEFEILKLNQSSLKVRLPNYQTKEAT